MWKNLLLNSCENPPPIVLAINKTDLDKNKREEIEEKFLDLYKDLFFCSALTGENVNELFIQASKLAFNFLKKSLIKNNKINIVENNSNKNCC